MQYNYVAVDVMQLVLTFQIADQITNDLITNDESFEFVVFFV